MKYLFSAIVALIYWNLQAQNLWDGSTTVTTTSTNGNVLLTNGNLSFGTSNTGWPVFINNTTRAGGIYNYSSYAAASTQYGIYNFLTTTSTTGNKYGIYNYLTAQTPGPSYGMYSSFGATGNGVRYGLYSSLDATGTGDKYGVYSVVGASSTGVRYGVYASVLPNGTSTDASYGIYAVGGGTNGKAGYFGGDVDINGKFILKRDTQGKFFFNTSNLTTPNIGDQFLSITPNTTAGADDWNTNNALTFYNNGLLEKSTNGTAKILTVKRTDLNRDVFRVLGDGKVYATEVNVMLATTFPDYVFQSTYELMPLNEVRNFIQANGHLPNIPKAETVAQEGVNLGEMTKVLVEKVEELTLYLMQQQDMLNQQQRLVEQQQLQIDALLQELKK